jgi:hypothetical protein
LKKKNQKNFSLLGSANGTAHSEEACRSKGTGKKSFCRSYVANATKQAKLKIKNV